MNVLGQSGPQDQKSVSFCTRDKYYNITITAGGWSGAAKVLGKLPVPGRLTNLDDSRAWAYCACSRCGWGCLDIFSLVYHFSLLSPSLGDGPI